MELNGFICKEKIWTENRENCMRLIKVGICEVMMDKAMKGGLQYMEDE